MLFWLGLLLLILSILPATATDAETAQRRAFADAERALDAADRETFERLAAQLENYALLPYLRAADLMQRLANASEQEVRRFLHRYRGTAPGERLRLHWLKRLAKEGRWPAYVEFYLDNGSETRECLYRRALHATGQVRAAFDGLEALYLTPSSLPNACDPLFKLWFESGGLTSAFVWRRIDLALERGNTSVARFQRRYLDQAQQLWLNQLLLIHANPGKLTEIQLPRDADRRTASIVHGIKRLARRDPSAAAALWLQMQDRARRSQMALDQIHSAIGAGLAQQGERRGLVYLRRIQPRQDNLEIQQQRLRAGLRLRAWADVAHWAKALPETADEDGEWRYWLGRALARRGDLKGAAHAFADAAGARSLWGFRAAELLGRPAALDHQPAPVDEQQLQALLASDTSARIRELSALGRDLDVRREWRELTRGMNATELVTAAALAARLGLITESIFTLARANYWDDMDLRFPLPYRALIAQVAAERGLPADWIYAVIRQESAFDADIASHAGAVGLMQLMPATAAEVARAAGLDAPSRLELTDPVLNLELGSRYLAAMQRRFANNTILATAAYNAGPGAVRRWLPKQPMAADLWMTEIPYRETRDYVRRVLTYRVIYAHKLGHRQFRLGALLRPITAPASPTTNPTASPSPRRATNNLADVPGPGQ